MIPVFNMSVKDPQKDIAGIQGSYWRDAIYMLSDARKSYKAGFQQRNNYRLENGDDCGDKHKWVSNTFSKFLTTFSLIINFLQMEYLGINVRGTQ